MFASIAGIASIGASAWPLTTGAGMPLVNAPVPNKVNAAIPQSMGSIPRPRKMKPVQVITRLEVSGPLVENMRIAVVCQQVCSENQSSTCQIRKVNPNLGLAMGSNPDFPVTVVTLLIMFPHPA